MPQEKGDSNQEVYVTDMCHIEMGFDKNPTFLESTRSCDAKFGVVRYELLQNNQNIQLQNFQIPLFL